MRITKHAKQRLLQRVFGIEDIEDKRSLAMAHAIIDDNSSHLDGCSQIVPLVGFKGAYLQIRNNAVITVLIK